MPVWWNPLQFFFFIFNAPYSCYFPGPLTSAWTASNTGSISVSLLMRKISLCQNPRSSVHKLRSQSDKSRQAKPNISLCFRLITTSDLKVASSFRHLSSHFNLLWIAKLIMVQLNLKFKLKQDLLHLSFTLKNSIFSDAYHITQSNICDEAFITKIYSVN